MRRPLIAGNWKLQGSVAMTRELVGAIEAAGPFAQVDVAVMPPFPYLSTALAVARTVAVGGQDASAQAGGAYTGEVSGAMLRDVGCEYVIVGHSERRALYGEADTLVARKFAAALGKGLVPILCVGESLAERDAGHTHEVVGRQLDAVLDLSGAAPFGTAVIAYEPVWAIGTGRVATPEQAQDVHAFVRGRIAGRDATIASSVRILYGGSVKAGNARELFAMPDVDGGLIGGASLKAEEFVAILAAAQ